jgi:hypothetical protein
MALGEHEVLSKSEGNTRLRHGKTEKSLPPREAVGLAAADGGRVAHKEKYSSERDQPAVEPPIVTTVWARNSGPRFQSGFHSATDNPAYFRRLSLA